MKALLRLLDWLHIFRNNELINNNIWIKTRHVLTSPSKYIFVFLKELLILKIGLASLVIPRFISRSSSIIAWSPSSISGSAGWITLIKSWEDFCSRVKLSFMLLGKLAWAWTSPQISWSAVTISWCLEDSWQEASKFKLLPHPRCTWH